MDMMDSISDAGKGAQIENDDAMKAVPETGGEKSDYDFFQKKQIRINKKKNIQLDNMSKEELMEKVKQLELHVTQLRNIISKNQSSESIRGRKSRKERPLDFNKYNTRHVALKLLYLGWDYRGYAVQEDSEKTIEHNLFSALLRSKLIESRETSNYHRCGRTDKGVSAFSQVVSIDLRTNLLEGLGVKVRENGTAHERPGDKTTEINYVHILNKLLPPEIRVICWSPVNENFSARFSCNQRTYKYFFPKGDLDLEKMNRAAEKLLGEHDFRNLCKMDVQNGVVNYMRRISLAQVKVLNDDRNGYQLCELTVVGKAFLWHQIRCIVAVLYLVGKGKEDPSVVEELLNVEKYPCKPQYPLASELPLVLFDSQYEEDAVDWKYDVECLMDNVKHMQELWTSHCVKTSIIKSMLEEFHRASENSTADGPKAVAVENEDRVLQQAAFLLAGTKPKVYKPLLEREKGETLEQRIEHFTKRRKIVSD